MNELQDEDDRMLFQICQGRDPAIGYHSQICSKPAVMRALLDSGIVDPNAKIKNGDSLLLRAVFILNKQVASLLVERGADVNAICGESSKSVLNVALYAWAPFGHGEPPLEFYDDGRHTLKFLMRHGARLAIPHEEQNEPQFIRLYQGISALCVLCTPLWVARFHRQTWLTLDCIRLLHAYLF